MLGGAVSRAGALRPNLAISLSVLAKCLEADEQIEPAITRGVEAITLLSGLFLRHKAAFAGLITLMACDDRRRYETLGREPDTAMLAPIDEGLATLQVGEANSG